jgi:hypothetical protein
MQAQRMNIRVSVIGYDLLGKRIADAVAQQPDMDLAGVFDDDASCQSMIVRHGYALLPGRPDQFAVPGDVAVVCRTDCLGLDTPVIFAAHLRSSAGQLFTPLSRAADVAGQSCVRIALPDVIALGRILQAVLAGCHCIGPHPAGGQLAGQCRAVVRDNHRPRWPRYRAICRQR